MPDLISQILSNKDITSKIPSWVFIVIIITAVAGWGFGVYMKYLSDTSGSRSRFESEVIQAHKLVLDAQSELYKLQSRDVDDFEKLAQQLVNMFDTPAWIKYLDPQALDIQEKFKFVVTNLHYSDVYGTSLFPRDMTNIKLYEQRKLEDHQRATVLQYAVNDAKAVRAGIGNCIKVNESAYPLKKYNGFKHWFKKCMLEYNGQTYVFGFQLEDEKEKILEKMRKRFEKEGFKLMQREAKKAEL